MKGRKKYGLILWLLISNFLSAQSFKVDPMPFSSKYNEYAPVVFKGKQLIFCSDRKNELVKVITDTTGKYMTDLYVVNLTDSLKKKISLFSKDITTPFNEGPVTFNADFSVIYFTRNLHLFTKPKDIEKKQNNLGIFSAQATDTGWTNVQPFPYNSDDYNIAHPSLSVDGKFLFFASDMPGGYGGSDLYVCVWQGDRWSKPKNLGKKINSLANEFFPFIHPSGRLYFASDRKGGYGGLDIYYADKKNKNWQLALPLDTPFNSAADDFGVFVNKSFEEGYFSSNRGGNDDVFMFTFQYPSFDHCDSLQEPVLCYDLYEEHALENDSMPLEYEWDFGDGTKARGGEVHHCFPSAGHYTVKLNVINTVTNEVSYNDATYDLDIEDFIQPKIHCPDTISVSQEVKVSATTEKLPPLKNIRYFWDFGDRQKGIGQQLSHSYLNTGKFIIRLVVIAKNTENITKQYGVFKEINVK